MALLFFFEHNIMSTKYLLLNQTLTDFATDYSRSDVWVVSDLAVGWNVGGLGRHQHLQQVHTTPHLEVGEVQATRQPDAAHLVVRNLLLNNQVSVSKQCQ